MAGEGAMSQMNSSLKFNRSQQKKRSYYKDHKSLFVDGAKAEKVELKKATPEQLQAVRERVVKARKREYRRKAVVLLLAIATLVGIFFIIQIMIWDVNNRSQMHVYPMETQTDSD